MEKCFEDKKQCCFCTSFAQCDKWYGELMNEAAKTCDSYEFNEHLYESCVNYVPISYDKSQCVYGPDSDMPCEFCSCTCGARALDFEKMGKKMYTDGKITYWK